MMERTPEELWSRGIVDAYCSLATYEPDNVDVIIMAYIAKRPAEFFRLGEDIRPAIEQIRNDPERLKEARKEWEST